nr:MAG TPA: hypothetical protein [Caudoviricetes sp.]
MRAISVVSSSMVKMRSPATWSRAFGWTVVISMTLIASATRVCSRRSAPLTRAFWRLVRVVPLICTIGFLSWVVRGSRAAATVRGPFFCCGLRGLSGCAGGGCLSGGLASAAACGDPAFGGGCCVPGLVGLQGFGGDAPACAAFLVPRGDLAVADAAADGGGGEPEHLGGLGEGEDLGHAASSVRVSTSAIKRLGVSYPRAALMAAISPSVKSLSPESLRASVVRESPTCLANARIETPALLIRAFSSV